MQKKQRRVQRPSLNFKRVRFLNAEVLAAVQSNQLYVDIHTVCAALRMSSSSQISRITKAGKSVQKVTYQNKVARLLKEEDTQWWLNTLTDELINKYAGRLVAEYRKALVSTLRTAFFDEEINEPNRSDFLGLNPALGRPITLVVEKDPNEDLTQRLITYMKGDMAKGEGHDLGIYKRLEENRTLRDKALLAYKEAEAEIQKYQELINKDLEIVNTRMSPGCRFYPAPLVNFVPRALEGKHKNS